MKFLVFWAICLLSWFGFRHVTPPYNEHRQLRDAIQQLKSELTHYN